MTLEKAIKAMHSDELVAMCKNGQFYPYHVLEKAVAELEFRAMRARRKFIIMAVVTAFVALWTLVGVWGGFFSTAGM